MVNIWRNKTFRFLGVLTMVNEIEPTIVTASANLESAGKISVRNMSVCFCAAVCLSGALSSATTPTVVQPIYSNNVSVISTIPSQTLVYDYGEFTVCFTNVGGLVLSEDIRRSLDALSEISLLENNWDNNGATSFSEQLVARCQSVVERLSIQPDIFPTAQGSIQFEWENEVGDYLEIEFFEDGQNHLALRESDGRWREQMIEAFAIGDCVEKFFARTV